MGDHTTVVVLFLMISVGIYFWGENGILSKQYAYNKLISEEFINYCYFTLKASWSKGQLHQFWDQGSWVDQVYQGRSLKVVYINQFTLQSLAQALPKLLTSLQFRVFFCDDKWVHFIIVWSLLSLEVKKKISFHIHILVSDPLTSDPVMLSGRFTFPHFCKKV